MTLAMNSLDRAPQAQAKPTFTLRIEAAGKATILEMLEKQYGFKASSIYPDLFGLAQYGFQRVPN